MISGAISSYDEALIIDPKHANTLHDKAIMLQNMGMASEAISCYDKALKIGRYKTSEHPEEKGNGAPKIGKDFGNHLLLRRSFKYRSKSRLKKEVALMLMMKL